MNQHTYTPPPAPVQGDNETPFTVQSWDYTWVADKGTTHEVRCIAFTTSRDLDIWDLSGENQEWCDTWILFLPQNTSPIPFNEFMTDPNMPYVGDITDASCPYYISEDYCAHLFNMDALITQAKQALELGQIHDQQDDYEMEDED